MPLFGEAKRRYQREWMRRRRDEWIAANGPCKQCGATEKLEVDHIDPATKSMNPRSIWSRTQTVREAELAKCQVLCEECHEKKSAIHFTAVYTGTGKASHPTKLTWELVRLIRRRVAAGETQSSVAADFNLSPQYVSELVRQKWWKEQPVECDEAA